MRSLFPLFGDWKLFHIFDSVRNEPAIQLAFSMFMGIIFSLSINSLCIHALYSIYVRKTRNDIIFFIKPYSCRRRNPSHSRSYSTLPTHRRAHTFFRRNKIWKNMNFSEWKNSGKKHCRSNTEGQIIDSNLCACFAAQSCSFKSKTKFPSSCESEMNASYFLLSSKERSLVRGEEFMCVQPNFAMKTKNNKKTPIQYPINANNSCLSTVHHIHYSHIIFGINFQNYPKQTCGNRSAFSFISFKK